MYNLHSSGSSIRKQTMTENISASTPSTATASPDFVREVAQLIVHALNLEIDASTIVAGDPLYGDGLGLDSIDILEVALVVSKKYGVQLRADHEDNQKIFRSLQTLADYIAANQAK